MNTKIYIRNIAFLGCLLFSAITFAQYSQQSKIVSPDRGSGDEFGTAVDIRGYFAISGTPRYDTAAGAAYIYAKEANGEWSQHQSLIPNDSQAMAEYGGGVKMMADYVVVASGRANVNTTSRAGALYIYDQNGTSWDFNTKIIASDYSNDALMGMNPTSIDAEADIIVAGAPGENTWVGSVYIFERIDGVWTEVQKIASPDPLAMTTFGIGVALSGETLVVGANEANGLKGTAYIYAKDANGLWVLEQQISAADSVAEDYFGSSVSVDDETVVVGAYGASDVSGSAYVFRKNAMGTWEETQKLIASVPMQDAHFGWHCQVKGKSMVIGAPHAWASTLGEVFLFQENDEGQWEETQIIQSDDSELGSFFGWSVALFEDQIITGAPWEETDENGNNPFGGAGSAYIFKDPSLGTVDFNAVTKGLSCYPNPIENRLTIESSDKSINNVKVYSINGLLLQEVTVVNRSVVEADTQHFAGGIYLVNVKFEDGSHNMQKVIKN